MKTIDVGEARFSVLVKGTGSPLVLLHGFPLSHVMWESQIETLSTTHCVIAPDLRGHGRSTVTEGTVTMRQMADDVASILTELHINEPVALCGLSMGGYVCWEFWLRHRERVGSLLLCDTRAAGDTPEVAKGRRMMAADVIADGSELAADAMLPKLLSPHTRSSQPDLEIRVRELIVATTPMGIAATQRGMAEREDMTPRLAEIDVPTLVICGADDVITPPDEMQRMTAAMTHATYVEIPQAGHLAPWERPDVVNSTMARFLDR